MFLMNCYFDAISDFKSIVLEMSIYLLGKEDGGCFFYRPNHMRHKYSSGNFTK